MNGKMYDHPATQQNLESLRDRGVRFVDPVVGELACGYVGMGKLAPLGDILGKVSSTISEKA